MLVEQPLCNTKFETNILIKYFFGGLTFLFTAPMVLGLLIIVLTGIEKNSSHLVVAVIGVVFVSFWCIYFGRATLKIATNKLAINNNKLIITYYGYLKKYQIEIFLDKIDEISVSQNILSKLLDCGQLSIKTIGGSHNSIVGINAPYNAKTQIQKCSCQ